MIERRRLGDTGLDVSALGLGAAALGNLYAPVTDAKARATIDAALDSGVNLVDVAPHYGMGLAERRVGDAVRLRDTAISTKVGRLLTPLPRACGTTESPRACGTTEPPRACGMTEPPREQGMAERHGFVTPMPFDLRYDYTFGGILRSHEDSLQRLGLAHVDLLLIHDIGARTHGKDAPRRMAELTDGGGLDALEQLKRSGAIRGWGLGVNEVAVCLEMMEHARPDVILLAGRYSLLEQGALERFFPAVTDRNIPVIIGGPYNSGLLAGAARYDYGPAPTATLDRARRLHEICMRHGVPLPAAALQFILAHPQVASVIPGARSAEEVQANVRFLDHAIPAALWHDLADSGLIDGHAPLPA